MHLKKFILIYTVLLCSIDVSGLENILTGATGDVDYYAETGDRRALNKIYATFNRAKNFHSSYIYLNLLTALRTYMECLKKNVQLGTPPFLQTMLRQNDQFLLYFLRQYNFILDEIIYTLSQLLHHNIVDGLLYQLATRLVNVASRYNLAQYFNDRRLQNSLYHDITSFRELSNYVQHNSQYLRWMDTNTRHNNGNHNRYGNQGSHYGNQGQFNNNPNYNGNHMNNVGDFGFEVESLVNNGIHAISNGLRPILANDYLADNNGHPRSQYGYSQHGYRNPNKQFNHMPFADEYNSSFGNGFNGVSNGMSSLVNDGFHAINNGLRPNLADDYLANNNGHPRSQYGYSQHGYRNPNNQFNHMPFADEYNSSFGNGFNGVSNGMSSLVNDGFHTISNGLRPILGNNNGYGNGGYSQNGRYSNPNYMSFADENENDSTFGNGFNGGMNGFNVGQNARGPF